MSKVISYKFICFVALLSALCLYTAPPAYADDQSDGYMDRMIMAMSGHEPPPAPEPGPMEIEDETIDQPMQTAGLPLLPELSDSAQQEPITELKIASDESMSQGMDEISPASGESEEESQTIISTAAPADVQEHLAPSLAIEPAYRLNIGDLLRVTVYGVTELSNSFRIDSAGSVTIPLVGEIAARGRLKEEVQAEIAKKLIDGGYYNSPSVTVEVMELAPFYILGEVKNPGRYPFEPGLDVVKAIATAGGYTPRASTKIVIIRNIDGKKTEITAQEDTEILPGDSIKVKQRFF